MGTSRLSRRHERGNSVRMLMAAAISLCVAEGTLSFGQAAPGESTVMRAAAASAAASTQLLSVTASGGMDAATYGMWADQYNVPHTCFLGYAAPPFQSNLSEQLPLMWNGPFDRSTCSGIPMAGTALVDGYTGALVMAPEGPLPQLPTIGPEVMGGISYNSGDDSKYLDGCTIVLPGSSTGSWTTPDSEVQNALLCGPDNLSWLGPKFFLNSRPQLSHWVLPETVTIGGVETTVYRKYAAIYGDGRHMAVFKALTTDPSDTYEPAAFVGVNGSTGVIEVVNYSETSSSSASYQHRIYRYHDRNGYAYWFFAGTTDIDMQPSDSSLWSKMYDWCIANTSGDPGSFCIAHSHLDGQLWKVTYDNGGSSAPLMAVGNGSLVSAFLSFAYCGGPCEYVLTPYARYMTDSAGRQYHFTYYDSGRLQKSDVWKDGVLLAEATMYTTVGGVTIPSKARIVRVYPPETITSFNYLSGVFGITATQGPTQQYTYASELSATADLAGNVIDTISVINSSGSYDIQVRNAYLSSSTAVAAYGDSSNQGSMTVPILTSRKVYKNAVPATDTSSANYDQTTYDYAFWSDSYGTRYWAPKVIKTTSPTVSTGEHGSGSATTSETYYDQYSGRPVFSLDAEGHWAFTSYDTDTGQVTGRIQDAKWSDVSTAASQFPYDTGSGLGLNSGRFDASHTSLTTTYAYDSMSRPTGTTLPNGRVTYSVYSRLADQQLTSISGPKTTGSGSSALFYGPASYSVRNLAGKPTFTATLAVASPGTSAGDWAPNAPTWVDTTQTDPVAAVASSGGTSFSLTATRVNTSVYDEAGSRLAASRTYTAFAGSLTSSASYDETTYRYDGMSHLVGVKDPTGTIRRTDYDALGRPTARWIGTNDFPGTSGDSQHFSTTGSNTMTETDTSTYAASSVSSYFIGTTLLDHRTQFPSGSGTTSDQRVTTYLYDSRNRAVVQINPLAPHVVQKYDHRNRVIATATYGGSSLTSSSGLSASVDPTSSATPGSMTRLSLSEVFYDARGQVWKTLQHKVSQSAGTFSTADDLKTDTWYDAGMKPIKSTGPSGLTKTLYDRLDRPVRTYTLASVGDDGSNANAQNLSSDVVLEESLTGYEYVTGNVLMSAQISRHHDQDVGVVGRLYNVDLDPSDNSSYLTVTAAGLQRSSVAIARAQISAMWYDDRDRPNGSVQLGTYGLNEAGGPSSFARSGMSMPSRSDTALVTTTVYNPDGTVDTMTDPKGLVAKTLYDQALRRVASIANYTGSSSGADHDVFTRYAYTNGLMTKMWVDLNGNGTEDSDDQVTQYVYGTTRIGTSEAIGTSAGSGSGYKSAIATGNLLRTAIYPPQTSGQSATDRSVDYAYDALGEQVWTRDQNGTVIQTSLDAAGRQTARSATTIASGVDTAVQRIGLTYTNRGQVESVTQYSSASGGSGTDLNGLKYTYDDWGNIVTLAQDHNSAVASSGGDDVAVQWAYSLPNSGTIGGGRVSVRRTSMTLLGSGTSDYRRVKYDYGEVTSGTQPIDYLYGRVQGLRLASVTSGGADDSVLDQRATYDYLGSSMVVGTSLVEIGRLSALYDVAATHATYDALDRFNRVGISRWTAGDGSITYYRTNLSYDRNSNITSAIDPSEKISGSDIYDTLYTMDGLNRIIAADRGTVSGSSVSGSIRYTENWTLTQTGNWASWTVDNNGVSGNELTDTRSSHSNANEITSRSVNSTSATPSYDQSGEMTSDGKNYDYKYDAFGRMVSVKNKGSSTVRAEYRYDGLGQRIGWRSSTSSVSSSDPWYWSIFDDRWRVVTTIRIAGGTGDTFKSGTADSSPKERFVFHSAGRDGRGGSSYIDCMLLADRDLDTSGTAPADGGWSSSASGTVSDRIYPLANWRNDTVLILNPSGERLTGYRYSAYGERTTINYGDFNKDGFVDIYDLGDFVAAFEAGDPSADVNRDGFVDIYDYSEFFDAYTHDYSTFGGGLRHLYAGYEADLNLGTFNAAGAQNDVYHVRYRVYETELGRWTRRDPLGYQFTLSLYDYCEAAPIVSLDSFGTCSCAIGLNSPEPALSRPIQTNPPKLHNDTTKCRSEERQCLAEAEARWRDRIREIYDRLLKEANGDPRGISDSRRVEEDAKARDLLLAEQAVCRDRARMCNNEFPYGPLGPERIRPWQKGIIPVPGISGVGHCFFCFQDGTTTGWAPPGPEFWKHNDPNDLKHCKPYSGGWDDNCVKSAITTHCILGAGNERFNPQAPYSYPANDCNDACSCMREAFVQCLKLPCKAKT